MRSGPGSSRNAEQTNGRPPDRPAASVTTPPGSKAVNRRRVSPLIISSEKMRLPDQSLRNLNNVRPRGGASGREPRRPDFRWGPRSRAAATLRTAGNFSRTDETCSSQGVTGAIEVNQCRGVKHCLALLYLAKPLSQSSGLESRDLDSSVTVTLSLKNVPTL
ncbi:hypothetical protein SKAU_G00184380 [Synaphobranchus kaupii]|uniref:Uncharacterized protein n=1 Tax=Synaphobranchus kaupii TaxID=118154 RepID=A0A9Q1IVQ4_SYNKA|nr:hypothetical protein SKAU_G00184380 [Synaphobranchus kaupii]